MKRSAALLVGAVVVAGVASGSAALFLRGDPQPGVPPLRPDTVSPAPPSATERSASDPPTSPRHVEAAPPPDEPAPRAAAPTANGADLVAQVREIVRRGEGAPDAGAEQAAARDLSRVLADLAARGEGALPDARLLVAPGEPPGVQEVGARVLAAVGSVPALEALADLARGGAPGPARLQALRALRGSSLPFARGALLDVALDRGADLEVRAYALDLMRDLSGAESTLHDVAADPTEPPQVRAMALDALLALEPARGRAVLAEVGDDEALRPHLEALRQR